MTCCKSVKRAFVNFRLKSCCCIASVKLGLNIIAYFKVLMSAVSLLSEGRFSPIANGVQTLVAGEGTAVPRLANITVILFNILLLIAVNKKITVLLRVFIYYSLAKISVMAVVLWPIINASEDGALRIIIITVIISIVFQLYIMLLIRSVMVQIKEELSELNGKAPIQITYTSQSKENESRQVDEATVEIHISKPTEEDSKRIVAIENEEKLSKENVVDVKSDKS